MSKVTHQIQFVSGECKGEIKELPEGGALIVGRSRSASVRLTTPDISGKHLELTILPSGDVALKNLSAHRTEVNGQALTEGEGTILSVGDRVALGETTVFMLEPFGVLAPVAQASHEAKTEIPEDEPAADPNKTDAPEDEGEGAVQEPELGDRTEVPDALPPTKPTPPPAPKPAPAPAWMAAPKRTTVAPPPHEEERDEGKTSTSAGDGGDNETMVMQTRVATLEEMDLLRKTRKPKIHKWVLYLAASLVVSAIFVGSTYMVSQTNIENPVTWPMDGDKYNDEVIAPDIGFDKDFILYFPRHRSMQVVKEPNRIMAMTRLGKRRDVPCRVIFSMNKSLDNLSLSRPKGFKVWQDKMMATGGQWNFDEDRNVHFRGKENGLPYQMARYTRSVDKMAWFGVVMYIKDRDWELIVQKEIPSSERYRGETLIVEMPFISVTPRYIMNHWEPGEVTFKMTVPDMLSEVRSMLNRAVAVPRMWPHILNLLRNILVASVRANDEVTYMAAMDLLRDLRTKQSQWLNNQKINYMAARAKNLPKLAASIRQDCLAVFSDEDDFRCHQLRNDQWD